MGDGYPEHTEQDGAPNASCPRPPHLGLTFLLIQYAAWSLGPALLSGSDCCAWGRGGGGQGWPCFSRISCFPRSSPGRTWVWGRRCGWAGLGDPGTQKASICPGEGRNLPRGGLLGVEAGWVVMAVDRAVATGPPACRLSADTLSCDALLSEQNRRRVEPGGTLIGI